MMEGQLNKYVGYLQGEGYTASIENEKIKICVTIDNNDLILWCQMGPFFPYEFPQIFIDKESMKKLPKMPHLYTDNSICIFDKSIAIPNFNEPYKLLSATIDCAVEVICKGIRGENAGDYIDEFLEYWSTKSEMKGQMFIEDLTVGQEICFCWGKEGILVTNNQKRLKELFKAIVGGDLEEEKIKTGLYIPLNKGNLDDIPKNDVDIVKMIEKHSSFYKMYDSFIQQRINKNSLIIFAHGDNEKKMLAGWIHKGPGVPDGFRVGHVNLKVAFTKSKEKGEAIAIDNCHQTRLFTRGGDGNGCVWKKVGVIGCGSVGSFLTDALKLSGVEEYVLVDNECLEYENVARHTCGYSGVNYPKVVNLCVSLQKWNPNIRCDIYVDNAHAFIETKAEIINACDVLFIAVASPAVEHHINRLLVKNRITIPVVYIWVEPYSLGGHAILLKEPQDMYKEIFDEMTFEYKYSIVKNRVESLKREAGCQSTYMPYSGFHLQQFIFRAVDCIMSDCWGKRGNYRISWCGKISSAKMYGVEISEAYNESEDYSLLVQRID